MDKTLLKGLQVLERVAESERSVRITDIAAALRLTKSNAHRVLKTLEHAGYLRQDERSREYAPSLKLWELGSGIVGRLDIRAHASDVLRKLAQHVGCVRPYVEAPDDARPEFPQLEARCIFARPFILPQVAGMFERLEHAMRVALGQAERRRDIGDPDAAFGFGDALQNLQSLEQGLVHCRAPPELSGVSVNSPIARVDIIRTGCSHRIIIRYQVLNIRITFSRNRLKEKSYLLAPVWLQGSGE